MSGGVRPKGSKSYAATRSPEAAEAFRCDQAAQRTLDAARRSCPKCGSDKEPRAELRVLGENDETVVWVCPDCGHAER